MERTDAQREAARLIAAQSWLALATVDESGVPSASYVPYAPIDGAFGIVVSRLAAHTANLAARRPASILVVDDGGRDRDAYARTRLSVAVEASAHAPGSQTWAAIWSALESRHGATVRILRELPDFYAVSLAPEHGRIVMGFASAHDVGADVLRELLGPAR
jgi:heme oxygenase (biliverdin-IX-beta and delta-forming)